MDWHVFSKPLLGGDCAMAGGREPLSRAPRVVSTSCVRCCPRPSTTWSVAAAEEELEVMLAVVKTATMMRSWRWIRGARDGLSDALIVRVVKTCTQASAGRACRTAIKRRARGSRCWQAPGRHVRCNCASLRELNRLSLSRAPQPDTSNISSTFACTSTNTSYSSLTCPQTITTIVAASIAPASIVAHGSDVRSDHPS